MTRVMVYVDGFNLYYGLKSMKWQRYYWLDPQALALNLLESGQQLEQVKYFTARISFNPSDPQKHKRQSCWLEAIASLPKVQLFFGHYLTKTRTCPSCGRTWDCPEEKMTDVNIAVELLHDAHEDSFDTALLISGDSDLTAPVRTVRSKFPQKRVIVIFPPKRQSKQLQSVAAIAFQLGRKKIHDSQLPNPFTKPDGYVLHRPTRWK